MTAPSSGDKLDADSIGLKSEIEFLRDLADILCPPDGVSPPDVKRAMLAISTMRMVLSRAPRTALPETGSIEDVREKLRKSIEREQELEAKLASKTRDADHFFQLSGRYLEELNALQSATRTPCGRCGRTDEGGCMEIPCPLGARTSMMRLEEQLTEAWSVIKAHEAVRDACFEALPECKVWGDVPGHIAELRAPRSTTQPSDCGCETVHFYGTPGHRCLHKPNCRMTAQSATGRSE